MAYIVNNTRGQIIAVVQDGTVNTTATSQTLVGKNVTPYGEYEIENLVHQLENFADDTAPPFPIEGQIWWDTSLDVLKGYTGTTWKNINGITVSESEPTEDVRQGDLWFNPITQQVRVYSPVEAGFDWIPINKITVATSAPSAIVAGETYFNSATNQLFVYDGNEWQTIGPEAVAGFAETRWESTTLLDMSSVPHAVIIGIVNGVVQSIVSTDTFTIFTSQRPTGFTDLVPGINMASGSVLAGRATNADRLTTARTINGVPFDGTANITITNTGALTAGTGLSGTAYSGAVPQTWSVDGTAANTANKVVIRNSQGGFAAGTIQAEIDGNVTGTASNVTGIVAPINGGTGQNSYARGNLLIGTSSGSLGPGVIKGVGSISISPDSSSNDLIVSYTGGGGVGNVTSVGITAGEGIGVSGSPITGSGNITVSNAGVIKLTAGTGLSVNRTNGDITINNTGVTSIVAGDNVSINRSNGAVTISASATPVSSGVSRIIAGSNITISPGGGTGDVTISSSGGGSPYTLPTASASILGGIKVGNNLSIDAAGVLSAVSTAVAARSLTSNGWADLGGNLLIQWGTASVNYNQTSVDVPFNTPFSSTPWNVQATISRGTAVSGVLTPYCYSATTTGFKIFGDYDAQQGLNQSTFWVAIGPTNTGAGSQVGSGGGGGSGGTVYSVTAGDGLTGGQITTAGTITVDSSVARLNTPQTFTGLKTFTGGIVSQAYNFTPAGASIFYQGPGVNSYPEPVVMIPVNTSTPYDYTHQFYNKRLVVEGSADPTTPGSSRPTGGAIIGIDNGVTGGSGVLGVHTSAVAGLGVGVTGQATNMSFTGAVFQTGTARTASGTFLHMRCYSNNNPVFLVTGDGNVRADGTFASPAADYAEYFEWEDGNPAQDDRAGMTVSLVGDKIRVAQPGDTVIGVVSAKPAMVGDAAETHWQGRYVKDEYGRIVTEPYQVYSWTDEKGHPQSMASYEVNKTRQPPKNAVISDRDPAGNLFERYVETPGYDATAQYVPRSQRSEWAAIGLVGKLRVRLGSVISPTWIKLRKISDRVDEYLVK